MPTAADANRWQYRFLLQHKSQGSLTGQACLHEVAPVYMYLCPHSLEWEHIHFISFKYLLKQFLVGLSGVAFPTHIYSEGHYIHVP